MFNSVCSLENMLWFCGFTQVKTKEGLQIVTFPRKLDVVSWFDPREGEGRCSIRYVLSKICCGFVVSDKGRLRRAFSSLYSLGNLLWFCGFRQGSTQLEFKVMIFSRKIDVVSWFQLRAE